MTVLSITTDSPTPPRLRACLPMRCVMPSLAPSSLTGKLQTRSSLKNHTGFSVWADNEIQATDTKRWQFLARYLERAPLALSKLTTDGAVVTYRSAAGVVLWQGDPLDFLARLSVHIPDRWEATTRYFGYYAARTRGARKGLAKKLASPDSPAVIVATTTTDEPVPRITSSFLGPAHQARL